MERGGCEIVGNAFMHSVCRTDKSVPYAQGLCEIVGDGSPVPRARKPRPYGATIRVDRNYNYEQPPLTRGGGTHKVIESHTSLCPLENVAYGSILPNISVQPETAPSDEGAVIFATQK